MPGLAFVAPADVARIPQCEPDQCGVLAQADLEGGDSRDRLHHALLVHQGDVEADQGGGFLDPVEILAAPMIERRAADIETEDRAMAISS